MKRQKQKRKEKPMEASNVKAMREALEIAEYLLCAKGLFNESKQMTAAISAPPRNCDVGTAKEQSERFMEFCVGQDCGRTCPLSDNYDSRCEFAWSQMPYDKGGAK